MRDSTPHGNDKLRVTATDHPSALLRGRQIRRALLVLLGTVAALWLGAHAWAFWTSSGIGTASATTSSLNAPTSVIATPSSSTVHLSWAGSTLSNGQAAQGYYATRIRSSDNQPSAACGTSPTSLLAATSCNDTLLPDGSYHYQVTAVYESWTAASSSGETVVVDGTAPTVTINQAAGQADPASASPIDFTVVFSEPVTGFTDTDISVAGTAGATTATVTGGPSSYNVAVASMTTSGTVQPSLAAGRAVDAAGNTNTASTSTDNTVTYDTTAPTVTITLFTPSLFGTVTALGTGGTSPGDNPTITVVICTVSSVTCPAPQTVGTLTTTRDAITGAWTVTSGSLATNPTLYARAKQTDQAGNTGTSTAAGPITNP